MESAHRQLDRLARVVEEFRKVDSEMPSQTIATFLCIAMEQPNITIKGVEDKLGLATASASRNVRLLSTRPVSRPGREKPGYGLVEYGENPLDYRVKVLRMTKKGYSLMQSITEILKGTAGLLLVVALAGCGVMLSRAEWKHAEATDARWQKDSYECEVEARNVAGTGGRETFGVAQSLAEKCMAVRGWKK